jgi:3-deoxy-D-manno-octulosonate 8-phosphate phosphatase (KDO 8-P phosphatase)
MSFTLFQPVSTLVFDIDGVLTNGTLLVLPGGVMARQVSVRDGYALQLAVKRGYRVIIISGGHSPEMHERMRLLGVTECFMRVEDKKQCLEQLMQAKALTKEEVLFMGDDIPDLEVMSEVCGVPCCPADAVTEIKAVARYISPFNGGNGCVRDVIEKVMKLQDTWTADTKVKSQ